jgi:hypothetical protein
MLIMNCKPMFSQYNDGLHDGHLGFNFEQGQEIFLYSTASTLALRVTLPHFLWVPGALSPGVKQLG